MKPNTTMTPAAETISFKPYHGAPYQKFFIIRNTADGKIKRIGKMLAPNAELAEAKARQLWTNEPAGSTLNVETPEQAQARYRAGLKKKRK